MTVLRTSFSPQLQSKVLTQSWFSEIKRRQDAFSRDVAQRATGALLQLPDMESRLGVCTLPSELISVVALYHEEFTHELRGMARRVQFPEQSQDLSGLQAYTCALYSMV